MAGEAHTPSSLETWDALFGDFYLRVFGGDQGSDDGIAAAQLAGLQPGAEILDVACGFGRTAIPLARAGYRVTGVDRSETLLAEARRRADEVAGLAFARADYRELPFADGSFDGALNLFTSLGYLGDAQDTDVLTEIHRVLRPGGRLVVELTHRDRLVSGFQEQDWRLLGGGRLLLEQRTFDPATGVAQTTQTVIDSTGERETRPWSVRVYSATELLAMLDRAGFAKATCHGGFDGRPFTTDTRLVIVARA